MAYIPMCPILLYFNGQDRSKRYFDYSVFIEMKKTKEDYIKQKTDRDADLHITLRCPKDD